MGVQDPDDKASLAWEKTRSGGKWPFILKVGVLWWGGFMAIAMSLIPLAQHSFQLDGALIRAILINLIVFPIGGLFFGWAMWAWGERSYNLRRQMGIPLKND